LEQIQNTKQQESLIHHTKIRLTSSFLVYGSTRNSTKYTYFLSQYKKKTNSSKLRAPEPLHMAPENLHIAPEYLHIAVEHVHIASEHLHNAPEHLHSEFSHGDRCANLSR